MNEKETGMLLADVARRDKREPSLAMLAMWHDALDDIPFQDAKEALRVLNRETTDFLMPAHIRDAVKKVRKERRRPSLRNAEAQMVAVRECELCDDRGYRLPLTRMVCNHRPRREIGAASRLRRILESGEAS